MEATAAVAMGAFSELDDDALTITLQATSLLSLGRLKLTCIDGHKGPTIVCFGDGEFGELMGDGAFNDVVVIVTRSQGVRLDSKE